MSDELMTDELITQLVCFVPDLGRCRRNSLLRSDQVFSFE